MPSHTHSREKVCALCWNRTGHRVERVITQGSDIEKALVQFAIPGYKADSLHAPCGICVNCRMRLLDHIKKKPNPRKLIIHCGFELGQIVIEDIPGQKCPCHICFLAGLKGGSLKAYIGSLSRSDEVEQNADMRTTFVLRPSLACNPDLTSVVARQKFWKI